MKIPDLGPEACRYNVKLASSTRLGTGGEAEVVFQPQDEEQLQYFLLNCDPGIPITVIGACSNMIIRDGGIDGVVIKLGKDFSNIAIGQSQNHIVAGCKAFDANVVRFAMENNIEGLEFLIGIPGTIGGNIRMNAGCYGREIKDIIQTVYGIDRKGKKHQFSLEDIDFSYRSTSLPSDIIFTQAVLKGNYNKDNSILENIMQIKESREKSQPYKAKTAGSTFRNPVKYKAWELIEKCGLKGLRVGGAEFSTKHANFLINANNATSAELEALGELARSMVYEKFNITLEWEVLRIGKVK